MENTESSTYLEVSAEDLEEQIEAFVPYVSGDDRRSKYLSYRASGFSIKESCKLVDVELRTLYRWREDPEFRDIETNQLQEIRKSLGADFTLMEFLRNTRLVLAKDFDIIMRAMGRLIIDGDDTDKMDILSEREWTYFKDAVKRYGPDQLMKLQAAIQGKTIAETGPAKFVVPWISKVQNNTVNITVRENGSNGHEAPAGTYLEQGQRGEIIDGGQIPHQPASQVPGEEPGTDQARRV